MALTEAQYKALIVAEVGDDAAGTVAAQIDVLWDLYADQSDAARYLRTKRHAITLLMGSVRTQVNTTGFDGSKIEWSDLLANLQAMLDAVDAEIAASAAAAGAGGVSGVLTRTAPIAAPAGWAGADANSRGLRGDAYRQPGEADS